MWFRCGLGLRRGRLSRPCLVVTRFTHVISLSRFLALSLFGPLPPLSVPKALETRQKKKKDSSIDRDRRSGPGGGEGRYTRGLWKPSEVVGRPTKRGPLPRRLRLTHHTATLEGNLGLLGGAFVTSRSDGGPVTTKQIHKICCAGGRTTPSKCLPSPYRSSAIRTNPTYPPPPPLSAVYFGSQRSKLSRLFVVGTRLTRRAVAGTGGSRLGISGGEGAD